MLVLAVGSSLQKGVNWTFSVGASLAWNIWCATLINRILAKSSDLMKIKAPSWQMHNRVVSLRPCSVNTNICCIYMCERHTFGTKCPTPHLQATKRSILGRNIKQVNIRCYPSLLRHLNLRWAHLIVKFFSAHILYESDTDEAPGSGWPTFKQSRRRERAVLLAELHFSQPPPHRVAKCQIFYTEQNFRIKFFSKKNAELHFSPPPPDQAVTICGRLLHNPKLPLSHHRTARRLVWYNLRLCLKITKFQSFVKTFGLKTSTWLSFWTRRWYITRHIWHICIVSMGRLSPKIRFHHFTISK